MKRSDKKNYFSAYQHKIVSGLFLTALLAVAFNFSSCEPKFAEPPFISPVATMVSNTTILELKTTFNSSTPTTIGKKASGDDYIIKGKVIGNDVSGNIYKNLMIQDATAAITIAVNGTNLFNTYHLGQELVINCTGLGIGKYSGLQQLGAVSGTSMTFMELSIFEDATQLNGLPFQAVDTLNVSIGLGTSTSDLLKYQSQLVLFKDVYFEDGGLANFTANDTRTTRYLKDASGNSLAVLNSQYSNFATQLMPKGYGDVVGILSYYNSAYQLLLIKEGNWFDFDGSDTSSGGDSGGESGGDTTKEANTTILELKTEFQAAYATVGKKSNGDDYIIKGVVVANDVEGNFYNNLVLQDATAAITVAIRQSDLYRTYPIGQEIVLTCTGLDLGKFNGLQQLGAISGTSMTFMDSGTFTNNAQLGSANGSIDTISISIATANTISSNNENMLKYQSQLVKFSDVKFQEGGSATFGNSTGSAVNRILENESGTETIIVRTRSGSTFATTTLPSGVGNVVGILSYYNAPQVYMRVSTDVYGFTKTYSVREEYVTSE